MDAARYAAMSDPDRNYHFSRRWMPPPLKRDRPALAGTSIRADFETTGQADQYKKVKILATRIDRAGAA